MTLTHSASPAEQTPQTPLTTSNSEFLAEIFNGLEPGERPMVLGIAGAINSDTRWSTGTGWTPEMVTTGARNWYFTLSTYLPDDKGNYRRLKAKFHRAFGIMLDDLGTKSKSLERLAACPPSYVIETSAGNHQAGYLFDQPCDDLASIEALQDALVAARLSDPGAKGPSARIGRLPCGINGKYSPPPECRLIEFHPERRYSIDQIVMGLELEPPKPKGRPAKPRVNKAVDHDGGADVYLPRAAESAVLAALRKLGLYKKPLGGGRHDITCPWVHEHTGGVDHGSAYFEPDDNYPVGGFKCQHSHGCTKRVGALLEFLGVTFTEAKHKPTIRVAPGELHRIVNAAEGELAAAGKHYQRGKLIVRVVTDPATDETSIKPVSANALMLDLSSCATWERFDVRSEGFVPTDPPTKHVNVLLDSNEYRHLPVLRGIARQPYLRSDGSLMRSSGFDSASGMFGAFDERAFQVPDVPGKASAHAALLKLQGLLSEFSFAQMRDMAAALAMILTAAIRPTLPVAPMGHIKAPQIASGKSYLSALIAAFAGPSKPSAYAFPSNEEECAKLLLSALMESPPVIVFDNLTTDLIPFKSLCSALTEERLTGRILGLSKTATVPTAVLFLSSGNNVDPVRDMARRVLTIALDPACETPATRKFNSDPLAAIQADRERYVSLALTIVRAYIVAGCPPQALQPLGSYSDWTRLVRAPLVWLGLPDPAAAMFTSMAQDPDRELLGRFLAACRKNFGISATSVRELVERAERTSSGGLDGELAEVVREVAEERGTINRRRLGRWIARHQGRIVGGQKFERDTKRDGCDRWRVVTLEVDKGVSVVSSSRGGESVTGIAADDAEVF